MSLFDGSVGKIVIIFGIGVSLSVHIDNRGKEEILIIGKRPTHALGYYVNSRSSIFN